MKFNKMKKALSFLLILFILWFIVEAVAKIIEYGDYILCVDSGGQFVNRRCESPDWYPGKDEDDCLARNGTYDAWYRCCTIQQKTVCKMQ